MSFCLGSTVSALGGKHSLNCVWELTYRCNARCGMCGYWRNPSHVEDELTAHQVKAGLDRVSAGGCRFVNFSGGEPTLRADLEDIVAHASSAGMWVSMVTNGSLLTRDRLAGLRDAGLDSLLVSLDSVDADAHDRRRGLAGSHARALECLGWLADDFLTGHRIGGLMTVVCEDNHETAIQLAELAERLGVYILLQPEHGSKTGRPGRVSPLSPSLVDRLIEAKTTSPAMLNSHGYLRALRQVAVAGVEAACHAGRKYFSVDPYGNLHACVDTQAVGHVLHGDLSVLSSESSLAAIRSCPGCWYCFRGEADMTLSYRGCAEKIGLGLRVRARNARRARPAVRQNA
jgi:MoaA/NifB/PqqE/SkfB family radical SAM enzyme